MNYPTTLEMPSLREEQVRLTQQRILDTFESELLERGYADISIRSVAKRAGISVPTVYRHYPNKEALLLALMESTQDEKSFNFYEILADNTDPLQTVAQLLEGTWDVNEQRPGRTKAILHAIAAPGEGGSNSSQVVSEIVKRFAFMAREALAPLAYLPEEELRKLEGVVALLISRPAWERLRYGHNMPRPLAQTAILDTLKATLDSVTSKHPRPKGYQAPKRTEAELRQQYEAASSDL